MNSALKKRIEFFLDNETSKKGWTVEGPVVRARKCDIYAARHAEQRLFAIKIYKDADTAPIEVNLQFDALEKFYPLFSALGEQASVPKPLVFWPEDKTIIMAWSDIPSLGKTLKQNTLRTQFQSKAIGSAGRWLQTLHALAGIEDGPFAPHWHRRAKKLENMASQNSAPQCALFNQAHNLLRDIHHPIKKEIVQYALPHGDFSPSNILTDGDQAIGIDFWAKKPEPVFADFVRMVVYLTISFPGMIPVLGKIDVWRSQPFRALATGYAERTGEHITPSFALCGCLLSEYLRRWCATTTKLQNSPMNPVYHLRIYNIRRCVKFLIQYMQDANYKGVNK